MKATLIRVFIWPSGAAVLAAVSVLILLLLHLPNTSGDRVLQTIGQRLRQFLPASAQLARVGGDEFAFLLPGHDQPTVDQWLNRLQTELSEPFSLARRRLSVASSMGVAMAHGDHPPTPQDLLRDAHTAMYRAKALNEYRYEIFASTMH
ncbi:MAG: hypothetical protein DCF17_00480 [Shackletoniella antarctica]|jgi:diguanylate cyclase (GGDEF)-like protein|uniref:GGDEF domain-containing protein n=1 Tax=Shackletoniella antarctica TaxID=268115 RepID=A0A2W4WMD5_9CYAN|nr:MAG: hypothetical protein DCF17_00480 [Shackletoniella antarctica]